MEIKNIKQIEIPKTIDRNLFFELKVFYGFLMIVYIALGILIVVG